MKETIEAGEAFLTAMSGGEFITGPDADRACEVEIGEILKDYPPQFIYADEILAADRGALLSLIHDQFIELCRQRTRIWELEQGAVGGEDDGQL